MRRVGISGTTWTGKSTTIRLLLESQGGLGLSSISLSQIAKGCPYPMVEEQTLDASRWMIEQVRKVIEQDGESNLQLFDRTPLDIMAFTMLAQERAGSDGDNSVVLEARELASRFDRIFYVPITEAWPPAQVIAPPMKRAFALLIDRYMRSAMQEHDLPVTELPWDLDERVPLLSAFMASEE